MKNLVHKQYYDKIESIKQFRARKEDYNDIKKKMFLAGNYATYSVLV